MVVVMGKEAEVCVSNPQQHKRSRPTLQICSRCVWNYSKQWNYTTSQTSSVWYLKTMLVISPHRKASKHSNGSYRICRNKPHNLNECQRLNHSNGTTKLCKSTCEWTFWSRSLSLLFSLFYRMLTSSVYNKVNQKPTCKTCTVANPSNMILNLRFWIYLTNLSKKYIHRSNSCPRIWSTFRCCCLWRRHWFRFSLFRPSHKTGYLFSNRFGTYWRESCKSCPQNWLRSLTWPYQHWSSPTLSG